MKKDEKKERKLHRDKKNPYAREAWLKRKKESNAKRPNPQTTWGMPDFTTTGYAEDAARSERYSLEQICKVFRVPPELIGGEYANRRGNEGSARGRSR